MAFEESIARLNSACASHLSNAEAQFQRGEPVRCIFTQMEDEPGKMRSGSREWTLEGPNADFVEADPLLNEIVEVDDVDYAISRIDVDRTGDFWTRITVRPVR